jgi:predicted TIM-barrel fold metal-dependent hydrolase
MIVIDSHVHPIYFEAICADEAAFRFRTQQFGVYKQSPYGLEQTLTEMAVGKIDKAILLPLDISTRFGGHIVSNHEIRRIVDSTPERFIGFGSVDPNRSDAAEIVEQAFTELRLSGLKLNPAKQGFRAGDPKVRPIYDLCVKFNKPIIFHSGMSWEPDAPAAPGHPLEFEDVAAGYPGLRICLAHFGWPWVRETVMLMIKYPNVYTDTAMLYLDSPVDFMEQVFTRDMGKLTFERNFPNQVMFGSNTPRFRAFKIKAALEKLDMKESTREKLFGGNALTFLGEKGTIC